MKTAVFLLACTCLINGLAASLNNPFEDQDVNIEDSENSFDIDSHLNIFFPENGKAENLIVPFPTTWYPTSTTSPSPWGTTPTYPTTGTWTPTTSTETTTSYPTTGTWTPTTPTETTTWNPTETTIPWITTSRRPRPTTTPRPSTTTRKPGRVNPQIYNNAVRSLGPFASRLTNVVLNKQGAQKTVQENEILYKIQFLKPPHRLVEESKN